MPRTPLLALTSDWHLQRGAWKRANTPQGDSRHALRQIAAHCLEHRLDLVGAGDLFDDLQPDTGTLEFAYQIVSVLRAADRRVLFTQGQHEKAYPAYLSLVPGPEHLHGRVVTLRGLTVCGMDHTPADRLAAEAAKVPAGVDLLACHQVWHEFMGLGAEGSLDLVCRAGGPAVVLTGDFHRHAVMARERVYSPGSTCLQEISEPREKAFFVMYDDFSVESVPLLTRRVVDVTVETPEDLEDLLRDLDDDFLEPGPGLPPELQKNVVYVQCRDIDQAHARVSRAVGQRGFLFWRSLVGESAGAELPEALPDPAPPRKMAELLPALAPEGSPVYGSVLRMLGAPDKRAEAAAIAAEFGR